MNDPNHLSSPGGRNDRLRKLVTAALFAAMIFAATWVSFPIPTGGNINLGDAVLLISSLYLGGAWGILAGAIGASLTDLLGAYFIYAPATFLIKGLMVLVLHLLRRPLSGRVPPLPLALLTGAAAELLMILGYYLYEATFLSLGFGAALLNIPFNTIQGAVAVAVFSVVSLKKIPK